MSKLQYTIMIIGSKSMYFKHDPDDEMEGVILPISLFNRGNDINTRLTRIAQEELPWTTPGFTTSIIRKSTIQKGTEIKIDEPDVINITSFIPEVRSNQYIAILRETASRLRQVLNINPNTSNNRVAESNNADNDTDSSDTDSSDSDSSDTNLWNLVDALEWVDKDEIVRNPRYVYNRITIKKSRQTLFNGMLRLSEALSNVFLNVSAYEELNIEDRNNFLFHVIGKGKDFYKSSMEFPEISLYLFEGKVQNLYSFIKQSI